MQNYSAGYPAYTQTQSYPYTPMQASAPASGATLNIGMQNPAQPSSPNTTAVNGANGVTINIIGAGVYPNGANINNSYSAPAPAQTYDPNYYMHNMAQPMAPMQNPTVPIASAPLNNDKQDNKTNAKKEVVLLTDDYIRTLENYIRNDNPDIKLMGAKELMKRFREDESRKNDPALTSLLNLTLQSKYSPVKMVGMGILENGWAQGDSMTQQLLAQIQQSSSSYGLDALDAASAALKSAGQTVKIDDPNPPQKNNDKK